MSPIDVAGCIRSNVPHGDVTTDETTVHIYGRCRVQYGRWQTGGLQDGCPHQQRRARHLGVGSSTDAGRLGGLQDGRPHQQRRARHLGVGSSTDAGRLAVYRMAVRTNNDVQDTWVSGPVRTLADWAVYRMAVRTNNDVEGWHLRLNHRGKRGIIHSATKDKHNLLLILPYSDYVWLCALDDKK